MGYVSTGFHPEGTEIFVQVRDKALKAKVVKVPFYKK
jgi:aminomethyltransferase